MPEAVTLNLILYDYTFRLIEWLTHTPNIDISYSKKKGLDVEISSSNKPPHNCIKYS